MPPISVVLFDAVGTLLQARPSVAAVYAACARRQGLELNEAALAQRFPAALSQFSRDVDQPCSAAGERVRWRKIVSHVFAGQGLGEAQIETIFGELWEHFAQPASWRLYDDVPAAMQQLAGQGYRLGVASNFDDRLTRICRGLPGLAPCEELFPVTRVGWAKPAAAYYARVAELLAVLPEQILLVGDEVEHDVLAPRRAGWQAVLLERGEKKNSVGDSAARDECAVIHDFADLLELPQLLAR